MAFCPQCGASFNDGAAACPQCGTVFAAPGQDAQQQAPQYQQPQYQQAPQYQQPQQQYQQYQQPYQPYAPAPVPVIDPKDHTAEFDAADISANKVISMAPYLLSVLGLIIALIAGGDSKYAAFHARNALKLYISQVLLCFLCIIPFLGWIVAGIGSIVLFVVQIICFVNVCQGKAKDAPIFGNLPFFK